MTALTIHALPSSAKECRELAARLGVPSYEIVLHRFPDGELRVTVGPSSTTVILYASLDQPNEKILALLFAVEALRRNGAKRIVLVAPYLCYMRQDAAFQKGDAISQRVIGQLFARAVDRIITVEAHLHRTTDIGAIFPGIQADNLSAIPAIADSLKSERLDATTVIIGPDAESRTWVAALAETLALTFAVARKMRHGDRSVDIFFDQPAQIAGRPALIADDIVSTGGTLMTCSKALCAAGAATVDAVAVHALFPVTLLAAFKEAGIRSIRSTGSVKHPTNAIPILDLLASALRDEVGNLSAPGSER